MLHRKFDLIVPGTYSSHISSRSTPAPKNLLVNFCVIESRHRPAIQPKRTGSDDQVCALQRDVPLCCHLAQFRVVRKQVSKSGILRSEFPQLLIKAKVVSDNYCDGRGHCLLHVAGGECWTQSL